MAAPTTTQTSPSRGGKISLYLERALCLLVGLAAAGGAWFGLVQTPNGQQIDTAAMNEVAEFLPLTRGVDNYILSIISVEMIAVVVLVTAVIAVVRRRIALALRSTLIIAVSTCTTQLLKHYLLSRPSFDGVSVGNSLPSGHVTAAAAAAVALTVVVPTRARSLTALLGGAWTSLMSVSVVMNQWHRPADVVAALGVVLCATALFAPSETGKTVPIGRKLLQICALVTTIGVVFGLVVTINVVTANCSGIASQCEPGFFGYTPSSTVLMEADFAALICLPLWTLAAVDAFYRKLR